MEKILNKKCLFSTIKDEAEKVSENDNPTGYIAFDFGKTQSLDGESLVYNAVNYL